MRARPSTSLSTTNTRCAMNLPPPARTPVAGGRQVSCTHRARPETGLTPRVDWLPLPTAFHKVAVCVQSLPDFDREGRRTERPQLIQLAVKAQKASSADVTQRTMPLEMWIDTRRRRSGAVRLFEIREPTIAFVAEATSAMMARIRMTYMRLARGRRISPERAGPHQPSDEYEGDGAEKGERGGAHSESTEQRLGGIRRHEGERDDDREEYADESSENA